MPCNTFFRWTLILLLSGGRVISAQDFVNNDLEADTSNGGSIPNGWLVVPYTDPVCVANGNGWASPDLTWLNGPLPDGGILGNPYSGNTFMSGLRSHPNNQIFQEGIMQEVSGFTPGEAYAIRFVQTVVKQEYALDTSGSWGVYVDVTLAGTTDPSSSQSFWNSTNLVWEERMVPFIATNNSHNFKFLPIDDDPFLTLNDETGRLRMGIDSIFIQPLSNLQVFDSESAILCNNVDTLLDASVPGATYVWNDGSTNSPLLTYGSGTYTVDITLAGLTFQDQITIYHIDCDSLETEVPFQLLMPNVFSPNGDGLNDQFAPKIEEGIHSLETSIYNRWGKLLYHTNQKDHYWQGDDHGEGVYYWVIRYTAMNSQRGTLTGSVQLLR